MNVRASDLSSEMVRLGKENFQRNGLDPDRHTQVDINDRDAVHAEADRVGQFDAVIALGVIPHVEDDAWFVEAMSFFLKPGGTLILQFRNAMFSMFTFNRLTKEFILDDLMAIAQQFKTKWLTTSISASPWTSPEESGTRTLRPTTRSWPASTTPSNSPCCGATRLRRLVLHLVQLSSDVPDDRGWYRSHRVPAAADRAGRRRIVARHVLVLGRNDRRY